MVVVAVAALCLVSALHPSLDGHIVEDDGNTHHDLEYRLCTQATLQNLVRSALVTEED